MQWTTRVSQVALLAAALGLGAVGQARAQDRHPARTTATARRITHADRKAAAVRRAELLRRAERERAAAKRQADSSASPTEGNRGGSER
jgi:uncharacterized protein HemX